MAQVGNKLYVTTSTGTGSLTGQTTGLVELSIEGIRSSSADISNIKSTNLAVSNDAFVGEKLSVGHSLSVGAGGISVDYGAGISTNGPIKVSNTAQRRLNGYFSLEPETLLDMTIEHDTEIQSGISLITFITNSLGSGTYASPIIGNKFTAAGNTSDTVTGSDVTINSNLSENAYGYKFNRASGTIAGGKKVYGTYIQNADENYLEGKLTIDGADNYIETTSAPAIASQVADENQFMSGYVNHANYDYLWTRVGNVVTCTGSAVAAVVLMPVPLGEIGAYCVGHGVDASNPSRGIFVNPQAGTNPTNVQFVFANNNTNATDWSKRFTFTYVIA
jgi:hypothetical protein